MILHSTYSEIDLTQWNNLVADCPTASFFQTPECYEFYESLSFMQPFVFGISENKMLMGVICGYVISEGSAIKSYFSRRAIVPGGALLHPDISPRALRVIFEHASSILSHDTIYIELRNYKDYASFRTGIESAGFRYLPHFNIQVSIVDEETTLKLISESKRRQLKSSQHAGVDWKETTDPEDIKAYYGILKDLYKRKVKKPLFPFEFFEKLAVLKNGKVLVVKYHHRVIGGMAFVILPGQTLYEWFVCGEEQIEKAIFTSVVATWAGIETAAQNRIPRFDFMGAGSPGKDYGVREFKSKFGGQLVENGRFLYICKPLRYIFGKFVLATYKYISGLGRKR